ncbi:MAG: sodium:proton antiporter [Bacteroidetes bacterium]|nr:sodium:proton antiporter [Bacteroidota bacterium]
MDFQLPVFTAIPFVLMLGCIAVMPLFAGHFWESNRNKLIIALILGIPTAFYLVMEGMLEVVEHTILFDYVPFIILLGSLFVITGGIFINADYKATPRNNTFILAIGGILASFMGTTGAAMLLIRLLLNTNKQRTRKVHTVLFFIAIVANCGGLLTPLGDPPLFMMYLRGADFFWFFNLLPYWLFVNGAFLIIYFFVDKYHYSKESAENLQKDNQEKQPLKITGKINFLWLLMVILAVAFVNPSTLLFMKESPYYGFIRDGIILIALLLSLITTKKEVRLQNNFNWGPIKEVAYLFLGIFLTMMTVLLLLKQNANSIDINTPTQFYYITGLLSSVLDNTPTAVTFHSLAESMFSHEQGMLIANIPDIFMKMICLGAVFFGSMTYIGNGPNFMVKSIAEQEGIKMPEFFQYIIKFSLIVILPVLILCDLIFFQLFG